jgi:hypothetical protein
LIHPGQTADVAVTLPPVVQAPAILARTDSAERKPPAPESTPGPAPVTAATPTPVRSDIRRERERARTAAAQAREDSIRAAKLAILDPAPALELSPLDGTQPSAGEQFAGLWRTMSWDGAQSEAGQSLPHIDGLPVLRVQVQANDHGKRPLMVVAQQLASGQVIQTIEGPARDVSELLSRRTTTSPDGRLSVTVSGAEPPVDQAMAMQVGDRMLAITGDLPSDSLRAMIRRINAEMRSK